MPSRNHAYDRNKIERLLQKGLPFLTEIEQEQVLNHSIEILTSFSELKPEEEHKQFSAVLFLLSHSRNVHEFAGHIPVGQFLDLGVKLLVNPKKEIIQDYLEIFRSPAFLTRIESSGEWADLILKLLHASEYTFPELFRHRAKKYSKKALFTVLEAGQQTVYTWTDVEKRVNAYKQGLRSLVGKNPSGVSVGFFTKNSIEMVFFDLACLTGGLVNVMIPANSVEEHIAYILDKTRPSLLIVSDAAFLKKVQLLRSRLPFIKKIIVLEGDVADSETIYSPAKVVISGNSLTLDSGEKDFSPAGLKDLATIMFTSGTTGNPKGIKFSHENIVFKRFARALALPEIGESDVFLCYLPLYHTFGRWLEMTGSIFWGAQYVFMESPAPEVMIENMQRLKPSVFISIPKKWYQLYEKVQGNVNLFEADDIRIRQELHKLTGGKLRWGLSAAGHLDVEVFQFFQKYGIELMSGFGMTEATGGITMTPPGQYKPNSLGKALPGIEIKLGPDDELLIRGPYVMMGYVNPEESDAQIIDGWFPTGDIMTMDEDNFIRIVDRKKEIYKNIKGETIAPQKIENYFRDFDFIKHVFLVGDNRPFNTLLIYPDYQYKDIDFKSMPGDDLRSYFSSVIVSVNRFLSPYERIVDFVFIDRDFDAEKGELTPKGTYRRKTVEKNFAAFIEPMYEKNYLAIKMDGKEIRIPNWFLREKGVTPNEIAIQSETLALKNFKPLLKIKFSLSSLQVGSLVYHYEKETVDLGEWLTQPQLWLGNSELIAFTGDKIFQWPRLELPHESAMFIRTSELKGQAPSLLSDWKKADRFPEVTLERLHDAALILQHAGPRSCKMALNYLSHAIKDKKSEYIYLVRELLRRTLYISSLEIQRRAFVVLMQAEWQPDCVQLVQSFLKLDGTFLNNAVIDEICKIGLDDVKLEMLLELTRAYLRAGDPATTRLFRLLSVYASAHPTRYKIIRQFLASCELENVTRRFKRAAQIARFQCRDGFRDWLGTTQEVAVDIETNREYQWDDVIIFEESIDADDKERLLEAIKNTTLIREAIFLFSRGVLVRLNDIPQGGLWISLLGKEYGKAVYRITIQTRFQGSFDIAANVNHDIAFAKVLDEINWLIQAGTSAGDVKLVEDFGGYWDQYDLWSEEFIQGETAGKFILRMIRQHDETMNERLIQIWPYFIWSGVHAYMLFWKRTGGRLELKEPTPSNIIIPKHDYQTGSRIVSISSRRKHLSKPDMLKNFVTHYIKRVEAQFDILKGIGKSKYVFSAIIESLGAKEGERFLNECLTKLSASKNKAKDKKLINDLEVYLDSIRNEGFIPKSLYFAIKRYHRWHELNETATSQARATTLTELYDTYELNLLEIEFPETRTRFFCNTVFLESNEILRKELTAIIREQQNGQISNDQFTLHVSAIQKSIKLHKEEQFFLARLGYPHLRPTDSTDMISLERGGMSHTDIVIETKDYEGDSFYVRTPVNPKEIARLHQLFLINNLSVQFRPDHQYLVAVNDRNQLIGGIFYKKVSGDTAHLEKIVVTDFYRKKGVSDGIIRQFFKRMKNEHYSFVTTGFFRPEYFYRFGFKIERKYAGLVKDLNREESEKTII